MSKIINETKTAQLNPRAFSGNHINNRPLRIRGGYCGHRGVNEPIRETIEVMKLWVFFGGGGSFRLYSGSTRTEGARDGAEGVKLHFPGGRGRLASAPSLQCERRRENSPEKSAPGGRLPQLQAHGTRHRLCLHHAPSLCSSSLLEPSRPVTAALNPGALIQETLIRTF